MKKEKKNTLQTYVLPSFEGIGQHGGLVEASNHIRTRFFFVVLTHHNFDSNSTKLGIEWCTTTKNETILYCLSNGLESNVRFVESDAQRVR